MIEGRFVDRLHLCNSCHSAFINFREACPGCRSSYLRVSDTIHHFACGCVAPEESYVSESALVCPKCERLLRHIGLDYDKPSTIYTCLVCSERFQDADVEGFCFDCQHVSPAEDLVQRDIKEYGLTPEGKSYSIYGMEFSVSTLFQDKLDFVDFTTFKTLLTYEIERIKRYRNQSCLAYLRISNLPQLYLRFGERKEEIALEIARIVQDSIRRSDVSAPMNDSTFVFLLVETPEQNCSQVTDRIESRLKKLVEQNFSAADDEMLLDFELNGIPLTGEFRVEELTEQLLVED